MFIMFVNIPSIPRIDPIYPQNISTAPELSKSSYPTCVARRRGGSTRSWPACIKPPDVVFFSGSTSVFHLWWFFCMRPTSKSILLIRADMPVPKTLPKIYETMCKNLFKETQWKQLFWEVFGTKLCLWWFFCMRPTSKSILLILADMSVPKTLPKFYETMCKNLFKETQWKQLFWEVFGTKLYLWSFFCMRV